MRQRRKTAKLQELYKRKPFGHFLLMGDTTLKTTKKEIQSFQRFERFLWFFSRYLVLEAERIIFNDFWPWITIETAKNGCLATTTVIAKARTVFKIAKFLSFRKIQYTLVSNSILFYHFFNFLFSFELIVVFVK